MRVTSSSSYTAPRADYGDTSSDFQTSAQGISVDAFSPGYFQRFFVVEKELGRGGKGVVLLVTHMLDNVELGQYACKRVPVGNDREWLKNVLNEVRLLEHLSHQHLVYYKHVWLEDVKISNFGPSVPCAFILQQYCNSGDLHQYIVNGSGGQDSPDTAHTLKERARRRSKNRPEPPQDLKGRKLRLEEIYSFFKDIASGLNHLHLNGFVHRDLKPSNCLLHDAGKGLRVLVSDFGEVQVENMVRKSTGATGTVSYCAPEVLRRSPSSGELGNFTTKSDIFSLGMILYFMCFVRLPYQNADHLNEENEDLDQLRDEIITWTGLHEERKIRPDLPEQLYTFLRRLLSLNPDDRPSADEILLGIKTGSGLDEISDSRPNAAAHIFDDLSASSRISPVDSPRSSTPANRKNSTTTGFGRPGAAGMKIRMSSYHRDRSLQDRNSPGGASSRANGSSPGSPIAHSPTNLGSNDSSPSAWQMHPEHQTDRSRDTRTGTSDSLVLRGPYPSPTKLDPPPPSPPLTPPHMATAVTQRRKILPPPAQSQLPYLYSFFFLSTTPILQQPVLSLNLLVLKFISLNWLCSPMAANAGIAYPLLALAALDAFWTMAQTPTNHWLEASEDQRSWYRRGWRWRWGWDIARPVLFGLVHILILYISRSKGVLCAGDTATTFTPNDNDIISRNGVGGDSFTWN